MGRLEKIVVMVVLFLVAVILGISLGTDPEESSPIAGRNGARAPVTEPSAPKARERAAPKTGPDTAGGLMNASGTVADPAAVDSGKAVAEPETKPMLGSQPQPLAPLSGGASAPGADPTPPTALGPSPASSQPGAAAPAPSPLARPYLVSRAGLEPTASEELMLYTWKSGDTFKAISETYYGSPLHVSRVRNANEGRKEELLVAGDKILVPVVPAAASDRIARNAPKEASAASTSSGGLYTVASGDVLGTISQKVYGTSKSWKKIFDANRDVIGENPNALKVGMRLRIPE